MELAVSLCALAVPRWPAPAPPLPVSAQNRSRRGFSAAFRAVRRFDWDALGRGHASPKCSRGPHLQPARPLPHGTCPSASLLHSLCGPYSPAATPRTACC
uniref:Secreted protein n=1 Tax=Knipowitschia caucasica TaxID=637954 RepID=A0AAV2KC02_KNICA